ncbi:gamma-glutamyl-gamma-aminobutyrate hydrolase family protein [Azospirillum isscasi]|uniref:Gamma-glutamyl-gamma-aminobutyrate hydrolase family protein n=1 Tax=Azospirillum isscasi TaxID=3053926 RepID=A0ABU0WJ37_9PROT|nr:gamma-glutamyl-gamma-aminobutyrate hydrolase family protein [Azospirillum isscasi]MDQ2104236.1 gamma-glutamyl-gamma-aminobutyrate hydrolase family protein [Azospirillum isscasi]
MTLPVIGLTQRVEEVAGWNERRDQLDQNWARFVHALGAVALPLPNHLDTVKALVPGLAGVILTGGGDPAALGGTTPERDAVETELIRRAGAGAFPLVGVCRGFQSLACAFGGRFTEVAGHIGTPHPVTGGWGGRTVNSFHRYGLPQAPEPLIAEARSAGDGLVEAIRHPSLPLAAVMWHPERTLPFDPRDIALFRNLLALP